MALDDVLILVRVVHMWWHRLSRSIVLTEVELETWMLSLARIIRRISLAVPNMTRKRSRVLLRHVVLILRVLDDLLRLNASRKQGRSSLVLFLILLQWVCSLGRLLPISG